MTHLAARELQFKPRPEGQTQVLNVREAAAFLGVAETTLRRLIKQGFIRAFQIPNLIFKGKARMIRIRIEELERIITENDTTGGLTGKNRSHWINAHTCQKIPVALAARILGMKGTAVSEAIQRGTFTPTPEGLHDYILHRKEKELTTKIRAKYRAKIYGLYKQVNYYKKKQNA